MSPRLSNANPPAASSQSTPRPGQPKPKNLGFGLGLRPQHYRDILDGERPDVDWFEAISENYMIEGGRPLAMLERVREQWPIVLHGVSMSVASTAPPDLDYLARLKALAARFEPKWISDHLCWTGVHGYNMHDLLPIPYTREALDHVCERIDFVQNYLGQTIGIENASTYVAFGASEMTEWDFIAEMTRRTGCWLIFDVNNVYVSAFNHDWNSKAFLDGIPADRVIQFHLAGHEHNITHIIDTHDHDVPQDVWDLYAAAVDRFGPVSTMIERDDHIPPLADLLAELKTARTIAAERLGVRAATRAAE